MIPYIHQIGDLLEREAVLTDELERKYLQEKIATLSTAMEDLVKTTTPIVPLLKGLETGNAPGQGKIKEVAPEQSGRPRNQMQDIISQMTQPENLQNMMGMVEQMMNPNRQGGQSQSGQSQGGQAGLGGLMSSMMGSMMSQPGGIGGLMSSMMGGMGGNTNNLSRNQSNASVDTNVPANFSRSVSNGGLMNVNNPEIRILY
jgi:hypothetical protein